jgi:hypothetical protein
MNEDAMGEIEVLEAIYPGKFTADLSSGTITFPLLHDPTSADPTSDTAMLLLLVSLRIPPNYPQEPPITTFTRTRGFGEDHLQRLQIQLYIH